MNKPTQTRGGGQTTAGRSFSDLKIDDADEHVYLPENIRGEVLSADQIDESVPEEAPTAPSPSSWKDRLTSIAMAHAPDGSRTGISFETEVGAHLVPLELTTPAKANALEQEAIKQRFDWLFDAMPRTVVGPTLRQRAAKHSVVVINSPGYHEVLSNGGRSQVYAWSNKIVHLGGDQPPKIVLTGAAAKVVQEKGSTARLIETISEISSKHPRALVVHCSALAAGIRRMLGQPVFTIILVGPTSTGKSAVQESGSAWFGPPKLTPWTGTKLGLWDVLSDSRDVMAGIDDVQEADDFSDVSSILMAAGNSAMRLLSRRTWAKQEVADLQCSPVMSSNRTLQQMAGGPVANQVYARAIEIHTDRPGGMFDGLSNDEGAKLADLLKTTAAENYGGAWPYWIERVSEKSSKIKEDYTEKSGTIRQDIADSAGWTGGNREDGRILDRLAFLAFAGIVASNLKVWSVERGAIIAAFGLIFREHLDRMAEHSPSMRAERMVRAVAALTERNRHKFSPLRLALDPNPPAGIYGYFGEKRGEGQAYFWIPEVFRDMVVEEHGLEVYQALRDAGYLIGQASRHNLVWKRYPDAKGGEGGLFVAIKASIRFHGKPAE